MTPTADILHHLQTEKGTTTARQIVTDYKRLHKSLKSTPTYPLAAVLAALCELRLLGRAEIVEHAAKRADDVWGYVPERVVKVKEVKQGEFAF